MSDNYYFDLRCVPSTPALIIAFNNSPSGKATHWKLDKGKGRLILAWHQNAGKDFSPFIAPINASQAGDLLSGWLDAIGYEAQPDHDGDNGRSFRIYCEGWGHVDNNQYAFAAIEPVWAMYGK